ncbi:beta-lactamase/transpeptidase-like protein [Trichoderma longibrachiatum]|uniref:Beta-lactamase/transpeptidase-like protein n=1 Tax=Trichoderma longibrachiatum ATCC 18648 TaxID=983965 RepID=A0A2T4BVQ3_TRILO|nr:beta-lactamase/transpeptidase-like protein [Trichoderma longibrachiatum ATCC 18648]
MAQIHGPCDPQFEALKALFQKNLDTKAEIGASITVNLGGKNVVDIYGGYTDEACTRPWEADTIVGVWSCTKGVTSVALLMLIDRGLVDPYEKVAKYWPEFAANGKEDIEIRHLLSHTSGLSGWEDGITVEEMCNQDLAARKLAAQAPLWKPGSASGYHVYTYGVLITEVIRRVTGKSLKQFVAEEIAGPLGADFQIGLKEEDVKRTSNVISQKDEPPVVKLPEEGSVAFKTMMSPGLDTGMLRREDIRKADLGSTNGFTNAMGMNRIFSVLALGGEVDGVRLLSPKTIELVFEGMSDGNDLATGMPVSWGIGYALGGRGSWNFMPTGRVGVWAGWGGSLFVFDAERGMTFTYAMNQMAHRIMGEGREGEYLRAVYKALGVEV